MMVAMIILVVSLMIMMTNKPPPSFGQCPKENISLREVFP